ncbi:hypothetical protein FB451DRAFT_1261509 [Mycena latifolia]|nr:hypothetical protein FB451DRAFT_1261509 [Mycena latifolia]
MPPIRMSMFSRARKLTIHGGTFTINAPSKGVDPSLPTRVAYWEAYVARLEARLQELEALVDLSPSPMTPTEEFMHDTAIFEAGSGCATLCDVCGDEMNYSEPGEWCNEPVADQDEECEPLDGCYTCGAQCPCGFLPTPPTTSTPGPTHLEVPGAGEACPCSFSSCADRLPAGDDVEFGAVPFNSVSMMDDSSMTALPSPGEFSSPLQGTGAHITRPPTKNY